MTALVPMCLVPSFGRLVLPMVGSYVTTLGLVILVVCDTGSKDIDVDDEGILVTSIIFPLTLSIRPGSCVSTFGSVGSTMTFL